METVETKVRLSVGGMTCVNCQNTDHYVDSKGAAGGCAIWACAWSR